jgi:uncharacterized transporter YbjL
MSHYTSRTFWTGTAERAIKTAAQTLLSVLTVGATIWSMDWKQALGIAAGAVVLSILTSIADPQRADTAIATSTATTEA